MNEAYAKEPYGMNTLRHRLALALRALSRPAPRRRQRMRGMTLVEIMIVVVIMGLIASAVGIAVFDQAKKARVDTASQEVRTMEHAIELWRQDHPSGCPTVERLVSDGILNRRQRTKDPWDNDYLISCENGETSVHSKGPDAIDGNEDDVPRRRN